MIKPLPARVGVGFVSDKKLESSSCRYELVTGPISFHNYYFTKDAWEWPSRPVFRDNLVIDGFSPNLNKHLHVGHLRNLALANALFHVTHGRFVALLGTSLGVYSWAQKELNEWFDFLNYHPALYYDSLMPWDLVETRPGTDKNEGTQVWINPQGKEIIVIRSEGDNNFWLKQLMNSLPEKRDWLDPEIERNLKAMLTDENKHKKTGRPTYSFYDLSFAKCVKPDYYVTGVEQIQHFRDLGLGDKHLPMGLVVDDQGKKIKSRNGDPLSAKEAMEMIKGKLTPTENIDKLAWNCLAWNFLKVNREHNVVFDETKWTAPDAGGLYITYTYARLYTALEKAGGKRYGLGMLSSVSKNVLEEYRQQLTDKDVELLGWAQYCWHELERANAELSVSSLANYLLSFCKVVSRVYNGEERIVGGRPAFLAVLCHVASMLELGMMSIGLFPLTKV